MLIFTIEDIPLPLTWDGVKAIHIGVFPGEACVQFRGDEVRLHRDPAPPAITGLHQGDGAQRPISINSLNEYLMSEENIYLLSASIVTLLLRANRLVPSMGPEDFISFRLP